MVQVTHKLLLKSLAALKSATKAGTAEMKETENTEGMVAALMDMALFCDRALREHEDKDDEDEEEEESLLDIEVSSLPHSPAARGEVRSTCYANLRETSRV